MKSNVARSLWARYSEIEEKGLDTPDLTDEEKTAVLQLQETLKAIQRGSSTFIKLQDAAKEGWNAFMIEMAKFNCRMAFISARTSDEVCRLVGMFRDNAETVEKQFELAKKNVAESKEESDRANKKANWAIGVAVISAVISIATGIYYGQKAHSDSEQTTNAIVMAIDNLKGTFK